LSAFIDTNVFIYAMELHPIYGETTGKILGMVDSGELDGFTSSLVLLEICWYLESRKKLGEMQEAIDLITGSKIRVEELKLQDIKGAVEDKTDYTSVDLNDLINYNVIKRLGLEIIYTNDSHFHRLPGLKTRFNE
jgi:predicted nucleic acid-binding protein